MSLQHWENYYRGGALATCPLGPATGYTKEIRDAWVAFFCDLPEGSRILDICTGNGAVALIARETAVAEGKLYEIHAIDLAQIDPVRDVSDGARLLSGIRFHPQVATEQLPFDADSFDAVSGQYALEYTAVDLALGEIHRVLRSGGRAQFILHHADSVIARNAQESLRQTAMVLEETMIFRKLRRYLDAERQSASAAQKSRSALVDAIEVLVQASKHATNALTLNVTIDAVQKILAARQQVSPAELSLEIGRIEGDTRASVHRLRDLIRTAQTETGVNQLAELARSRGFELHGITPQYHAVSNLVGWRMRLAKP